MHALMVWDGFKTQRLLILYPHKRMVCNWVAKKWNMVNSLDERKKQREYKTIDESCEIYQVVVY